MFEEYVQYLSKEYNIYLIAKIIGEKDIHGRRFLKAECVLTGRIGILDPENAFKPTEMMRLLYI